MPLKGRCFYVAMNSCKRQTPSLKIVELVVAARQDAEINRRRPSLPHLRLGPIVVSASA